MIKDIVGEVRALVRAGTSCLHSVQKHYAFRNTQNSDEVKYFQLQIEKAKLHLELDKTELAKRKNILAEEGVKKYGVAAIQDMLARKEATTEPKLFVNEEELEQVVSGLQAAMQHNPHPDPFPQEFFLKHGKEVSAQEIVEELEGHIRELQDKLRNDTDAAAYQGLVNKLALTENRFQRAMRDCKAAEHARDALHAKNVELTGQLNNATATSASKVKDLEDKLRESKAREEEYGARLTDSINRCRELEVQVHKDTDTILNLRDTIKDYNQEQASIGEILGPVSANEEKSLSTRARGLKGKVKELEDKLADCGVRETRFNNEVQFLKKALSQTTGVPILAAMQQVKVE